MCVFSYFLPCVAGRLYGFYSFYKKSSYFVVEPCNAIQVVLFLGLFISLEFSQSKQEAHGLTVIPGGKIESPVENDGVSLTSAGLKYKHG